MAQTDPQLPDPQDGGPAKQHGDPLLAAAQGRGGSGDDGSRHGHDATAASRETRERTGDDEPDS